MPIIYIHLPQPLILSYLYPMSLHENYMYRCLHLAELGAGKVAPNPMVGSVLVYKGRIVGEGFHEIYGQAHAEVNCIRNAEKLFQPGIDSPSFEAMLGDSTIYVSLEPCAHFGKTPPCADLIIESKIPRAVVGCRDPFPLVNGKGIEKLEAAGVEVILDVLADECRDLNKRFFTWHTASRPYIVLKWAQSMNAMIAGSSDQRTFISNEISNRLVHKWRSEETAILVGTTTALADNPSLTNRLWSGASPVRVLLDMELKVPEGSTIFDPPGKTIIFNGIKNAENNHLHFFKIDRNESVPAQIMSALFVSNIQSIIIEGGAKTLQSFIDTNLWDEARVITATELLLEKGTASPILRGAKLTDQYALRNDTISFYKRMD